MPIIISVIKPSNCSNLCNGIVLASSSGNITPYIIIIQIEPIVEPIMSMISAVITNGLLGLKACLLSKCEYGFCNPWT